MSLYYSISMTFVADQMLDHIELVFSQLKEFHLKIKRRNHISFKLA